MNILVLGGTGATGRLLVRELLSRGCSVTIIVRNVSAAESIFKIRDNRTIIPGNILEMDFKRILELVQNFDAITSCLGHNLTLKGIFGEPRYLVSETIQRLCKAIKDNEPKKPVKLVLMNTTAVLNKDTKEKWSAGEGVIMALLRVLLPPQRDNEEAAEFLRTKVGTHNPHIEWVAVRPDTLIQEDVVSPYRIFDSRIRSPLFNAGKTSRINVGDFMAELLTNAERWNQWAGKMPVIYNTEAEQTQSK